MKEQLTKMIKNEYEMTIKAIQEGWFGDRNIAIQNGLGRCMGAINFCLDNNLVAFDDIDALWSAADGYRAKFYELF